MVFHGLTRAAAITVLLLLSGVIISLVHGSLPAFGAFGLGYFLYGKRQQAPIALASGVLLMVFPYFVPNAWLSVLIGAALLAVPWFVRI